MKILQIIPSLAYGFGGPGKALLDLCGALARKGQDVTIYTTNADARGKLEVPLGMPVTEGGFKVFYFPVNFAKHYKFSSLFAKALKKNISFFDIAHIHSLFQFPTLAAAHYCRKFRKPYIIRPLGQLDPFVLKRHSLRKKIYLGMFERKNLEAASGVHCTTEVERDWCKSLGLKIRDFVIPMGVDLRVFRDAPDFGTMGSKYPQLQGKKVILFLSRINFKKGLDILVKAFALLSRERNDVHLLIAGPDDEGYGRKVKNWLIKKGVLGRVTFAGMLLGRDKLAAFRDSDLFVLPSYSENFGMAVIEAMACGTPVLISDKVGIYKEVKENNAGMVVTCREEDIYRGIKAILDKKSLAEELSFNGRKMVEMYYNIDKVADKMLELYEKILKT